MIKKFKDLIHYNYSANKLLIAKCLEINNLQDDLIKLFSHILAAHDIWNCRIQQKTSILQVWNPIATVEWVGINEHNMKCSFDIIDHIDLETPISYQNSQGQLFTNSICEILTHVINHSTYHRGQLSPLLRVAGIQGPISTDYIFYKRGILE